MDIENLIFISWDCIIDKNIVLGCLKLIRIRMAGYSFARPQHMPNGSQP